MNRLQRLQQKIEASMAPGRLIRALQENCRRIQYIRFFERSDIHVPIYNILRKDPNIRTAREYTILKDYRETRRITIYIFDGPYIPGWQDDREYMTIDLFQKRS